MTEYYLNKRSGFNYAVDTVFGTPNPATNWAWAGKVEKVSDDDKQNLQDVSCMDDSDVRTVDEYYPMTPEFGATVEGKLQHFRFPSLAMGADGMTVAGTHRFGIDNVLKSFSMQLKIGHSTNPYVRQWTGCMMKSLELNVSKGDWLRFSAGISAQKMTRIPAFKPYQTVFDSLKKYSVNQLRPYRGSDSQYIVDGNDVSYGVQQARLSLNNDLLIDASMDQVVGNYTSEPIPQNTEITAALTVKMKSYEIEDAFLAGNTLSSSSFNWDKGTESLSITFEKPKISKLGVPIDIGGGVVIQEISLAIASISVVEINGIDTDYNVICG